jgi:hypothetical protein
MSQRTKSKPDTGPTSPLPPILKRIINAMWSAAHPQTPESEARNAAMLACRLLVEHNVVLAMPATSTTTSAAHETPPPPPPSSGRPYDFSGFDFDFDSAAREYREARQRQEQQEQERRRREAAEAENQRRARQYEAQRFETPYDRFDRDPNMSVEDFIKQVNEILEWEKNQAARKADTKAQREAVHREAFRTRTGTYSAASELHDDDDSLLTLEQRKARREAWRRAGCPMRKVYDASTNTYADVPDLTNLRW